MKTSFQYAVALPLLFLLGCDSTEPATFSITIDEDINAFQGESFTVPITVTRSNFDGPITLVVSGGATGVIATVPATVAASQSTVNLEVEIEGSAAPGTSDIVITASAEGQQARTATTTLTVRLQGSYTLAMLNGNVTAAQSGSAEAVVRTNRTGQNASLVTLSATNVPAGVTARWSSTTTSGAGTTVWFDAGPSVPVGAHQITINGTASGIDPTSTVVTLNVIAAPAVAPLTMTLCANDMPVWLAYRNEGYGWLLLTPTGADATYNATDRTTIAMRFAQRDLIIYSATRAELNGTRLNCPGTVTVTGVFGGLSGDQLGIAQIQGELISRPATTPEFSIPGRRAEVSDLVAARAVVAGNPPSLHPDRLVLRRDINLATTTSVGEVNFTTEGITPVTSTITLAGGATGETLGLFAYIRPSNRVRGGLISSERQATSSGTLQHFPDASLIPADMHELLWEALFVSSTAPRVTVRQRTHYVSQVASASMTLPPALPTPSIDSVASTPYRRVRAQLASRPEYDGVVQVLVYNSSNFIWMAQTAGFAGTLPSVWEVVVPDFTGLPGFSATWVNPSGRNYQAEMFSAPASRFFGAPPVNGQVRLWALDLFEPDFANFLVGPDGRRRAPYRSRSFGEAVPSLR